MTFAATSSAAKGAATQQTPKTSGPSGPSGVLRSAGSYRHGRFAVPTAAGRKSAAEISLYYEIHGSGPNKVLLVMGLSATSRAWDLTLARLLINCSDYTICVFDNRGVGESTQQIDHNYTIKDMAKDTFALLNHIGWTRNVFLCGVSMGGMIAQELTLLAPSHTFAAIALVSTHAGLAIPPVKGLLKMAKNAVRTTQDERPSLLFSSEWLTQKPSESDLFYVSHILRETSIYSRHADKEGIIRFKNNYDMVTALLYKSAHDKPNQSIEARNGQIRAVLQGHYVSKDRLAFIGQLGMPVKIFTGTNDNLVHHRNSYHLAKSILAPLEVFDGCGHVLSIEASERFHNSLVNLFKSSPEFIRSPQKQSTLPEGLAIELKNLIARSAEECI